MAAKIGRNLQVKHVNGPLGREKEKERDSKTCSPRTSPKVPPPPPVFAAPDHKGSGKRTKIFRGRSRQDETRRNWVVGKRTLGKPNARLEEDEKKELRSINDMQIVKNRLANIRRAKYLANRMFNHRVNNTTSKTSILVTGYGTEPDPEEVIEDVRRKNRFVIEKFLQTQSQNRRVFERLNSTHVRSISDIEIGKAEHRRRRSDSSVHEATILEETEEREKEGERRGVKRRVTLSSFPGSSATCTKESRPTNEAGNGGTLKKAWDRGVRNLHSKKEAASAAIKRGVSKFKKAKTGSRRRLRRKKMKKEEIREYMEGDDVISKSSGTDEVDEATPKSKGATLETLFEGILLPRPPVGSSKEKVPSKSIPTQQVSVLSGLHIHVHVLHVLCYYSYSVYGSRYIVH